MSIITVIGLSATALASTWSDASSLTLPTAVEGAAFAEVYPLGVGVMTGGDDGSGAVTDVQIIDPLTGTVTSGSLSFATMEHTATFYTVDNGDGTYTDQVMVYGGRPNQSSLTTHRYGNVVDPISGAATSTRQGPISGGRRFAHAASFDKASNRVIHSGGQASATLQAGVIGWQPDTDRWSKLATMNTERRDHGQVTLDPGVTCMIGGRDASGNALASIECLDASTYPGGSWTLPTTTVASLATARSDFALLVTGPKTFLVVGGTDGTSDLATIEEVQYLGGTYTDPANWVVSTLSDTLDYPRSGHCVGNIGPDYILVVGGSQGMVEAIDFNHGLHETFAAVDARSTCGIQFDGSTGAPAAYVSGGLDAGSPVTSIGRWSW